MDKNRPPVLADKKTCTGCSACANICPNQSIRMLAGKDGFLYPSINTDTCINCLACEKTCPVVSPVDISANSQHPKVYACWNKDKEIRAASSSGGAFSALASAILSEGGIVAGAAYDDKMHVAHRICNSIDNLDSLRGSKYVQCCVGDAFKVIQQHLNEGKMVLFVGTPCQNAGLRKFLKKGYPNMFFCDFICHGTPSPLLFQRYLEWIEKSKGIKIATFNFRSKKSGWYDAVRMVNNAKIMKGKYDAYFYGFNRNYTLRESCYNCPEIGLPRIADITIADFWGIGMKYRFDKIGEIKNGISLVMLNNAKGEALFEKAKKFINYRIGCFDEALAHNMPMIKPSTRPAERDRFYADMAASMDFDALRSKYLEIKGKARIIAWLRENAPYILVTKLRELNQILKFKLNGSKTIPQQSEYQE